MKLTDYEVTAFTAFAFAHMDPKTRHELGRAFPQIYNKIVGRSAMAAVPLCTVCGHVVAACQCPDRALIDDAT